MQFCTVNATKKEEEQRFQQMTEEIIKTVQIQYMDNYKRILKKQLITIMHPTI